MANSTIYNRFFGENVMKGGKSMITKFNFNGLHLMNLIFKKKEFLILIFANLIAQLGITYYIMNKKDNPEISFWPLLVIQIIIIYVLILVPMHPVLKFLIFCIFSYTFGLNMSHLKTKYDPVLIDIALKGALSIFGFMLTVGVVLVGGGIHLGYKFGAFLFWALLALIIAKIVNMLGPQLSLAKKVLSYAGLGIFSLFIIWDTNQILSRDYKGDFITASMDYYLDILNLFTNFLGTSDN
jgi:FtsH-binding integral membrane protein